MDQSICIFVRQKKIFIHITFKIKLVQSLRMNRETLDVILYLKQIKNSLKEEITQTKLTKLF